MRSAGLPPSRARAHLSSDAQSMQRSLKTKRSVRVMTENKNDALDQALEFTFPAGDPIAVGGITGCEVADDPTEAPFASDKSQAATSSGTGPQKRVPKRHARRITRAI